MTNLIRGILALCCIALTTTGQATLANAGDGLFVATGSATRAPGGWVDFCAENPRECAISKSEAQDVVLSGRAWRELKRINTAVNTAIRPLTDQEHYGVLEKWTFPEDGYGDCEDYVLLKQRLLISAGWPRQALLITVVRDQKGEGHAVLTVKSDRGEFILDNQNADIVLWSETNYRFVKRQSQSDPNAWVSLGDSRPAHATASSR